MCPRGQTCHSPALKQADGYISSRIASLLMPPLAPVAVWAHLKSIRLFQYFLFLWTTLMGFNLNKYWFGNWVCLRPHLEENKHINILSMTWGQTKKHYTVLFVCTAKFLHFLEHRSLLQCRGFVVLCQKSELYTVVGYRGNNLRCIWIWICSHFVLIFKRLVLLALWAVPVFMKPPPSGLPPWHSLHETRTHL